MKSILRLTANRRAALIALLFPILAVAGHGYACFSGALLQMGECEWQYVYVGWCWGTGYECVPGTEDQPWSEEGSGGEVWSREVCSAQVEEFFDLHDEWTWYESYCLNWWMWTIFFTN